MTDNEIIKALGGCGNWQSDKTCEECPANNYGFGCAHKMAKHALDLINRQKAEIERLQHYKQSYEELKAEHLETVKLIKNAETEAVKRFAKKLVALDDIEKITKEMVGDE